MKVENGQITGKSERDGIVLARALLIGQNKILTRNDPSSGGIRLYGVFEDESIWSVEIDENPRPFSAEESQAVVRGLCASLDGSFKSVKASGIRKYARKEELSLSIETAVEYLGSITLKSLTDQSN
jgi:hypothetical protein